MNPNQIFEDVKKFYAERDMELINLTLDWDPEYGHDGHLWLSMSKKTLEAIGTQVPLPDCFRLICWERDVYDGDIKIEVYFALRSEASADD